QSSGSSFAKMYRVERQAHCSSSFDAAGLANRADVPGYSRFFVTRWINNRGCELIAKARVLARERIVEPNSHLSSGGNQWRGNWPSSSPRLRLSGECWERAQDE